MKRLLFIFALICPLQSVGQAWSGLLTSNRAINWQTTPIGDQTGPSPTVYPASWFASLPACATQPSSQTLSALDSAIAADQGAGTQCKIDLTSWGTIAGGGTIGITYAGRANVYLVGTPGQTVLQSTAAGGSGLNTCNGLSASFFCAWNGDSSGNAGAFNWPNAATVTSGYTQGSTTLVFSSIPNLRVGSEVQMGQADPSSDTGNVWFCGSAGFNGACSQQGATSSPRLSGTYYSETQMFIVTGCGTSTFGAACTSTTITVDSPVLAPNWNGALTPTAWWQSNLPLSNFGIYGVTLDATAIANSATVPHDHTVLMCSSCADDVFAGMETISSLNLGDVDHYLLWATTRLTVEFGYGYGSSPGSQGYMVDLTGGSSRDLILSTISQKVAGAFVMETGVANAVIDNTAIDNYFGAGWMAGDSFHHQAGSYYNLWEGDIGTIHIEDDIHGTAFANTMYRDYYSGADPAAIARNGNTLSSLGQVTALVEAAYARYANVVGNVLGNTTTYGGVQPETVYQSSASSTTSCGAGSSGYIYTLGFSDQNGTAYSPACLSTSNIVYNDLNVATSLMRWGNWDAVNGSVQENSSETGSSAAVYPGLSSPTTTFPASLFFSSQPSWWSCYGAGSCPWPGIGPDVTGGNISGTGGHANLNPAQACYLNQMGGSLNGSSALLTFAPPSCYAGGSTPTLPASTFSPSSGTYATTQTVTISNSVSGAVQCVTTDGSTPTEVGNACSGGTTFTYTTPLTVASTTTIRVLPTKSGYFDGPIAGGVWTISTPTLTAPTYSPDGNLTGDGYFLSNPTVTMSSASVIASEENVQDGLTGWDECYIGTCPGGGTPGGSGTPSAVVQTINNATPSLSGASMKLGFTTSQNNTNVLWTYTGNGCDECDSFNSNFELYPPATSTSVGALEMDMFNFDVTDNTEFMFGFQWNQTSGVWQVFNQNLGTWVSTSVTTGPTYGAWNHIQIFNHRVPGDTSSCSGKPCMHYDYFILNGTTYTLNMSEPAGTLPGGWTSAIGFQFQMDSTTVSGATTFTEYLDEASLNVAPNIYYTTNGTTPTTSSTLYTAPFALTINTSGVPLQSIAAQSGYLNSPVTSSTYSQRNIIVHSHSSYNGGVTVQSSMATTVTASAGDGIECGVVFGNSTSTVVVTDNLNTGNYAVSVPVHYSSGTSASVGKFYMTNAAAGSTTVTATFSSPAQYVGMACRTLTPISAGTFSSDPSAGPTPPSVDQTTANPSTGGATPSGSNRFISCDLVTASGSATAGAGYFLGDAIPGGPNLFREYQIQSAAASANCPYTAPAGATTDQQIGYYFNTSSNFSLSVSTSGTGTGTITGCAGSYASGAPYSCTVTPAAGSVVASVTGCNGQSGTMPSNNCTVVASFTLDTFTLTATTNTGTGAGSLSPSSCSNGTYNYGSAVTCIPLASSGSYFAGWTGGSCSGTTSPCNFTLTGNATVNAVFNLLPLAPLNLNGLITQSGNIQNQ